MRTRHLGQEALLHTGRYVVIYFYFFTASPEVEEQYTFICDWSRLSVWLVN